MKRRHPSLISATLAACFGCVTLPDPPPPPADLSLVSERYENPSARLTQSQVRAVLDRAREIVELLELLAGMQIIRTLISDTSSGLDDSAGSGNVTVQGVVQATFPCFGDGPAPTADGAVNGTVSARFGIQDSRLRRAFDGSVEGCRFRVESVLGAVQRVVVSADLVGDLGADLGIGDELVTPILIELRDLVGTSAGSAGNFQIARPEFDFRLLVDGALETSVALASLGLTDPGNVVVLLRADGSVALRDAESTWTCVSQDSACELVN